MKWLKRIALVLALAFLGFVFGWVPWWLGDAYLFARTSLRPFTRMAAATPVATAAALQNSECSQGICHDVSG